MIVSVKKEYLENDFNIVDYDFKYVDNIKKNILLCFKVKNNNTSKTINFLKIYPEEQKFDLNYFISEKQVEDFINILEKEAKKVSVCQNVFKQILRLFAFINWIYSGDPPTKDNNYQVRFDIEEKIFNDIVLNITFLKEIKDNNLQKSPTTQSMNYKKNNINIRSISPTISDSLEKCAVNLNEIEYKYDPAVGREDEIKDTLVALTQGSCVLVGEPGVGKTAIAEGIAYRIKHRMVSDNFQDKQIYKISASSIVSGCKYVGDLEEKTEDIFNDVLKRKNIILFFDEIHTAIGTGKGTDGTIDIANILKPLIDRGQIKIIGATTNEEYDKYIGKDPAFRRRLEKVVIEEPEDELYNILDAYIYNEIEQTQVQFNNKLINRKKFIDKLIELTKKENRVQTNMEYNPGLAISIIKKAFSYAVYYRHKTLEINDIIEAIEKCEYINEEVKEKYDEEKVELLKEKTLSKILDLYF